MIVAVVGTGKVGTSLLHFIVLNSKIYSVLLMSRTEQSAKAAIMQVASVFPQESKKIKYAPYSDLNNADIIILTAGVQMQKDQSPHDVRQENLEATKMILTGIQFKKKAIIITLATPVDELTPLVHQLSGLPNNQVIGFGGDLDHKRLITVLQDHSLPTADVHLIGEHGKKAIPVYPSEQNYQHIAEIVREYLFTITKYIGPPHMLATSILLNNLINTIVSGNANLHYVCGYHPEYEIFLTWPFQIGTEGIIASFNIHSKIGNKANSDLQVLIQKKRAEMIKLATYNNTYNPNSSSTRFFSTNIPSFQSLSPRLKNMSGSSKFTFLCVDFQKDFSSEGGIKYNNKQERIKTKQFILNTLIPLFRLYKIKISEIISDDRLPRACENIAYCVPGTWGYESEIPSDVKLPNAWVKAMYSPEWIRDNIGIAEKPTSEPYQDPHAFSTWLNNTIGNPKDSGQIILFGLTVDCCVLYTALQLHFRGYKVRILSEAVDTADSLLETKQTVLNSPIIRKLAQPISWEELKLSIEADYTTVNNFLSDASLKAKY